MKKIIGIIIFMTLISCSNQEEAIDSNLLKEIKVYINKSESQAKARDTYFEHDIYLIIFSNKESVNRVEIIENNYYFKENLDGYINIGDNKVFFYNSNKSLVNIDLLKKGKLEKIPDEKSDETLIGLDPEVWQFLIRENNSLEKTEFAHAGFGIYNDFEEEIHTHPEGN